MNKISKHINFYKISILKNLVSWRMRIAFVNQNSEVNVTHEKKANTITIRSKDYMSQKWSYAKERFV